MAIGTLLDWCSVNGIRIHPNLRIIHNEKMGICVHAANYPIMSDQSRKRFPHFLFYFYIQRDIRCCAFQLGQLTTCIYLPPWMSVVVIPKSAVLSTRSCKLADHIPHAPYGHEATLTLALALYSEQCVRETTDRALLSRVPTPISAFRVGYYSLVLDGPGTCSRSLKNRIGTELHFSGAPPCMILCRLATLAMTGAESSRVV